jgi:ABC-2 type transport system permease protein
MSGILSIARKEIRSYFLSPVAVIFLAVFLLITLFSFFTQSRFFIRGIADVRPLFQWMPLLLIFLVSAVSMRQWSEEQKMGTLEVLLTLPLRTSELVIGKFLAGLTLVALALALTLPLPWTVADLGPLDMGPVMGGYLASILLASAYLSIGLCVSALSDNQIVSLMLTLILCGLLYFLGSDTLMGFVGQEQGELLGALGSGSRFTSIERGVIDFRDLAYYLSICIFFLFLNTVAIERKRIEKNPGDRVSRWKTAQITAILLGANLIFANIHMHELRPGRIDLTEDQLYSVSDITVDVIQSLDEKMRITGYFSERTHPLLAPLVPQIKDLLQEYKVLGGNQLEVDFIDPHAEEGLEEELSSNYGIRSIPISVADRTEMAFVNAYFHILIRYGDEYQVLDFENLVDIRKDHSNESVELRLKGLEYGVTKAMKAVSKDFLGIDALMASQSIKITTYMTSPSSLPTVLQEIPNTVSSVLQQLQTRAQENGGTLQINMVDPSTLSTNQQQSLADKKEVVPIRLLDGSVYYLYGVIEIGERSETLMFLQKELNEKSVMRLLESAIRRSAPGFKKTIAIFTKQEGGEHPAMPYGQAPPPPKTDYRQLEQVLGTQFTVKRLTLKDKMVPSDVDVLFVAKAGKLTANQKFAIDQYLMSGGTIIALAAHHEIEPEMVGNGQGQIPPKFKSKDLAGDLINLLQGYGVDIKKGWVVDPQSLEIVYPVSAGFNRVKITQERYPYFPQVTRNDFIHADHVTLSGLNSLSFLWPSAIDTTKVNSLIKVTSLLQSSALSWLDTAGDLSPSVQMGSSVKGPYSFASTLEGEFKSLFTEIKPTLPMNKEENSNNKSNHKSNNKSENSSLGLASSTLYQDLIQTGRVLHQAVNGAKLAVIASPDLVSDLGLGVGQYYTGLFGLRGDYNSSLLLIQNLIEWAVEDDSLASIRTAGASSRVMKSLSKEEQSFYEIMNYFLALLFLLALTLLAVIPRRMAMQTHGSHYKEVI